MFPILIIAAALSADPRVGPEWSPVVKFPQWYTATDGTKSVRIAEAHWNYHQNKWYPELSEGDQAWLKTNGHILLDWRWDLAQNRWVRKRGPRLCLT